MCEQINACRWEAKSMCLDYLSKEYNLIMCENDHNNTIMLLQITDEQRSIRWIMQPHFPRLYIFDII
jgi:hypothetical protein